MIFLNFFKTVKTRRSDRVSYAAGLFADHLMIFHLFITYWDIISRIGQEYTKQNAYFLTSDLFDILHHLWQQNKMGY